MAHALQSNAVREVSSLQAHVNDYVSIQTLTTLSLDGNEIGAEEAQHLMTVGFNLSMGVH
jgi:hypothetical protein